VSVLKVTLALAAAWLLGGCSTVRLAYDNADLYVKYRAGSYLDLHGRDTEELDERIDSFFAWHRSEALPEYARVAEEAAKRVGKGLSREDLVWGYDSLVAHARHSLRAVAERIAPLLDRLTPQQVAYMEKGFAADNRRYARENLRGSEQERRERRAKRVQERLEDWVGNLSQAQVERIREYSQRAPLYDELRDRDRKRLQAEVLEMARARQAQQRLAERLVYWERGYEPAHLEASRAARQEFYALLLDLDRSMTPEQRALAQQTFARYAQDFALLASPKGQ
jgi:hypothetical protein